MSPTRRDILKSIAALGVIATLPVQETTAAPEASPAVLDPLDDLQAVLDDDHALLDAYCPPMLHGFIQVVNDETKRMTWCKIEIHTDRERDRFEIRLDDLVNGQITIPGGRLGRSETRLMVALDRLSYGRDDE